MLAVRLLDRFEAPAEVVLDILPSGQAQAVAISGRLQQSIPGQFADYLLALALPAGSYRIKALRDAGLPAADRNALLAALDAPLEVADRDPGYLGRLSLRVGTGRASRQDIAIEDHYDDDTLFFRAALPDLRNVRIGRALLPADALLPAPGEATATESGPPGRMEVDLIAADSTAQLVEPARGAFSRYLKLPLPRAFATNETGAYGHASGRDAVSGALRLCAKQSKGQACRLFAVDQTLLSATSCKATMAASAAGAPVQPGCALLPVKLP